jgi:hypothetical protein
MTIPADFNALWNVIPTTATIRSKVPCIPNTDDYKETCCIQLSYALNMCRLPINYYNKGRVLTCNGMEFMLAVKEMRDYLGSTYGDAEIIKRVDVNGNLIGRIAIKAYLDSRQGVIAFGQRHIDLWNGTEIHGKAVVTDGIWDAPSAISQGIFFWDVSPAP